MLLTGGIVAVNWEQGLLHLVREIAKGNHEALEQLHAQSELPIKKFLSANFGITFDQYDIDAIFEHTMFRIWQKGATLSGETDEIAGCWIIKIAKNRAYDLLRIIKKTNDLELNDERIDPVSKENIIDLSNLDIGQFYRLLTPREKEAAERLASGYKDVDIARELHIARSRVNQIKAQLKAKYQKYLEQSKREQ